MLNRVLLLVFSSSDRLQKAKTLHIQVLIKTTDYKSQYTMLNDAYHAIKLINLNQCKQNSYIQNTLIYTF